MFAFYFEVFTKYMNFFICENIFILNMYENIFFLSMIRILDIKKDYF